MMRNTDLYKGKYRIESTRLKEWDYSTNGYYFVTICTKNQECVFGRIADGKMLLTRIGNIAKRLWLEIPEHFKNVELDEFIIMPNHIHGIVIIENQHCRDAINGVSTTDGGGITLAHNPMLSENSLSKIIRWYKGRCTFEINKIQITIHFAWQSRFYDHIIRNEKSLQKIREYIHYNPLKWGIDEYNTAVFGKPR